MKKIELLNCEGPIMILEKIGPSFMIVIPRENYQIEMKKHELARFITGMDDLITLEGTRFNYPEFAAAKPEIDELYEFIFEEETKPIVYLASPYSNPSKKIREERFEQISQIAADLNAEGVIAFSPITYGHTLLEFRDLPTDWNFWKTFCLSFLEHADELWVYQMEGWKDSRGIQAEIEFAEQHGIPVIYKSI
jgi:hypothetical protein